MTDADSATQFLRAATRENHEAVDSTFSRFGISTPEGYRRFLEAHARILPRAEMVLDPGALIEGWEGRTAALASDLAELGIASPPPVVLSLPQGEAARWGAIYVIEGSRLGGAVLSRMVPEGLPGAYLGARHGPGAWRGFLQKLDEADRGPTWREQAAAGAKAMFAAYQAAAKA